MHINDILTPEQIEFYLKFFKALDEAEGFHKATAEDMVDYDFSNFSFIEKNIRVFKKILNTILPHRDEDIKVTGTAVKVVVSELEDRWKCYDYNSRLFYRREKLRSLGAFAALKGAVYIYERDVGSQR